MNRTDIIQTIIDRYNLTMYLEIGVFQGENFNKINCKIKHSVDPNFPATFQMTSDEFFKDNQYHSNIGDPLLIYDIIFIDGLHEADQVYRDIVNSIEILNPNGFIIVHDCNPITEWHTRPESEYKRGEEWNGTTYKGFIKFKDEHPSLSCFTINSDYGCGIITREKILENKTFILSEDIGIFTFKTFNQNRNRFLQLISEEEFLSLLQPVDGPAV